MTRATQTPELHELMERWNARWSPCPPIGHELRSGIHADRWIRFHSLPHSKRYAQDEEEYGTVLHRHNTVLEELFTGGNVYTITCAWSDSPQPPARSDLDHQLHPAGRYWTSILTTDDPDPEFRTYTHLYTSTARRQVGSIDPLLRAVADDQTAGVIIADTGLSRLYHPYDGGADVILATTAERDQLRQRHSDWLSSHPAGL